MDATQNEGVHARFLELLKIRTEPGENGCVVWTGARAGHSPWEYASFRYKDKLRYGHRIAYEVANGQIPNGMFVDHTCHNTLCVESSHLRLVTRKQNQENRLGARRDSTTGVRGVIWHPDRRKYNAVVIHNGEQVRLGRFRRLEDAADAVLKTRLRLYTHNDADREGMNTIADH